MLRKVKNKIFIYSLLSLLTLPVMTTQASATEDAIIAVVNDELITLRDLKEYVKSTYISLASSGMPEEQLKKAMLELELNGIKRLVEDKVILSHANKIGLTINDKLLEERLEEVKGRYPTEADFMQSLIDFGVTINDIKDKILEQLKIKYVINHEVRSKIYINPKEVNRFYEKNKDRYKIESSIKLDSLFIAIENDRDASIEKAKQAYAKILSGEDFKSVAGTSDSPSIGQIKKGQLLPSVEDEIFNLKEGDISSIITVDSGVYIFKINEIIPNRIAPLDEVSDSIKNQIFQQKFQKRFQKWLTRLKKDAYIEIKN